MTPTTLGFDGKYRERFLFNTTIMDQFFTGVLPPNTIDVQVSIRGSSYASNPDLIVFEDTSWSFPNPSVFPDGFELLDGENTILIRAILANGDVTPPCEIRAILAKESSTSLVAEVPTNISLVRHNTHTTILCDGVSSAIGYNFYASLTSGGGSSGYVRLNANTVISGTDVREETSLFSVEAEEDILLNSDGTHLADPTFIGVSTQQKNQLGINLKETLVSQVEVPESTSTVKTSVSVSSIDIKQRFSFDHYRSGGATTVPATIPNASFSALLDSDLLYYVITAIYFDLDLNLQFESPFSVEVVGSPLGITTSIVSLPRVTRQDIRNNFIGDVLRAHPDLRVEPNSVLSDTVIQPFSTEVERVRFIIDFMHRSQSFSTLLVLDDPSNSGESQPFVDSSYKQALQTSFNLSNGQQVQALIDSLFEHRASNYGIERRLGRRSIGRVTLFTTTSPSRTLFVPSGTFISSRFYTTQPVSMYVNQLASYYNPSLRRWEVEVTAESVEVGTQGNVLEGGVSGTVLGLSVVNGSAFFGGQDRETNAQLARRTMNSLASVDTGTERGYLQLAADIVGVRNVQVVPSGHALMQRDLDDSGVHRGGKVDLWIRGSSFSQVTDNFAFQYTLAKDIQFEIVGSPLNLIFRASDDLLSESTPILEMLQDTTAELSFRNASTGQTFDLTGVVVLSYNTIQLSSSVDQPNFSYGDVLFGDYRRLDGSSFTFTRQPAQEIISVVGTISGSLPTSSFELVTPTAPLDKGSSIQAGSYLNIIGYTNSSGARVPSGQAIVVSNESHVIMGGYSEYLNNLGIDSLTVVVTSPDGLTTYRSPSHSSGISDYTFVRGSESTPLAIKRTDNSEIKSGSTVLVSYQHDENFTVTYTTNSSVIAIQESINTKKHVTADVLVKSSVEVPVDLELSVALVLGASPATADRAIRTNLANFFNNLKAGDPVRQSDIVDIVDSSEGVSYVVVPISRMTRQEGSLVVSETLSVSQNNDVIYLSGMSNNLVSVYLVQDSLFFPTYDTGGLDKDFRGVYINDSLLVNVERLSSTAENVSSASALTSAPNRSYIVGNEGAVILGYTDDQTLIDQGYTDIFARQDYRKSLTQNRVLVSCAASEDITTKNLKVTYYVSYDRGVRNLDPIEVEYHTLGELTVTYDEDVALQSRSLYSGSGGGSSASGSSGYSSGGSSSGGY
jgi:uncharacterized phage protein gp47/JayE/uncharacterized membrane protein YgcG